MTCLTLLPSESTIHHFSHIIAPRNPNPSFSSHYCCQRVQHIISPTSLLSKSPIHHLPTSLLPESPTHHFPYTTALKGRTHHIPHILPLEEQNPSLSPCRWSQKVQTITFPHHCSQESQPMTCLTLLPSTSKSHPFSHIITLTNPNRSFSSPYSG